MISATNIHALADALNGVSLQLAPGEYLALLGANGSGKSTLLKALQGLIDIDEGQVSIEGVNPFADAETLEARQQVGYVQQRPDDQIVATSVEDDVAFGPENLGLPREELRARVTEALAAVGLSGFELREPHTLSGGQKQRLVIAGALALHPRYLLLDEPTSQLDPQARDEVLAILDAQVARGCGVLHVTHDLAEARRARRMLVLHEGELVFEGSYDELLRRAPEELMDWGIELEMPAHKRAVFVDEVEGDSALALSDVSLTYESGNQHVEALHNANLVLKPGEFILVRGATGSGKSTLLNLMAGFLEPSSGTATIDGAPLSLKTTRGQVGLSSRTAKLSSLPRPCSTTWPLGRATSAPTSRKRISAPLKLWRRSALTRSVLAPALRSSFPAARRAARQSRACWRSTRAICWLTSRPRRLTLPVAMRCAASWPARPRMPGCSW